MASLFLQGRGYDHQNSWLCFCSCLNGPIKVIFQSCFSNFWKMEIFIFDNFNIKGSPPLEKNWKFPKTNFFFKKLYFFFLNLYSTCSKLSFEVYNSHVSKNFKFWPIFMWKISFFATVFWQPAWPKLHFIKCCFWCLWTAKDQKIQMKVNFGL